MLIECKECKRQISDQAAACPHCGYAEPKPSAPIAGSAAVTNTQSTPRAPAFLIVSGIALLLSLYTPRLLLFFPIMLTLGCAALSLVRRESGRPFAVIVLICGVGLLLLAQSGVGGGTMDDISQKIADDAIDQYYIAERQGDKMQICVQAGFVTAALLQQKDEARYKIWKQTEERVCRAAGVPRN